MREQLNVYPEDSECAFCLNSVNAEENIIITCCRHVYHAECWTAYVYFISKRQKISEIRCPTCRNLSTGRIIEAIKSSKNKNE